MFGLASRLRSKKPEVTQLLPTFLPYRLFTDGGRRGRVPLGKWKLRDTRDCDLVWQQRAAHTVPTGVVIDALPVPDHVN